MSTKRLTSPRSVSRSRGLIGSLDSMVMFFWNVPRSLSLFMANGKSPDSPGAICLGYGPATVQPHDGLTLSMSSGASPSLVSL